MTAHYQKNVLPGYPIRGERATGPKTVRVDPLVAAAEAGNAILLEGDWIKDFLDEIDNFTGADGMTDDQVIAAAGAFKKAMLGAYGPLVW